MRRWRALGSELRSTISVVRYLADLAKAVDTILGDQEGITHYVRDGASHCSCFPVLDSLSILSYYLRRTLGLL